MLERYKPPEVVYSEKRPFVIRGHHLINFMKVYLSGMSAEKMAKDDMIDLLKAQKKVRTDPKASDLTPEYFDDLIGTTRKQANHHRQNMAKIYKDFLTLPDDQSVSIVSGKKDEICGACTGAGNHCNENDQSKYGADKEVVLIDMMQTEMFVGYALIANKGVNIEIKQEIVTFSDSPPQEINIYTLPAKALKNTFLAIAINESSDSLFQTEDEIKKTKP